MPLPWDDPSRPVLGMSLDGGRPCIDLLNTLRPAVPFVPVRGDATDLLASYGDLLALAVRTAVLPSGEADTLQGWAARDSTAAYGALAKALEFRALLGRLLVRAAQKAEPPPRNLAFLEELRTAARSFEVLVWEDGRYRLLPRYQAEGLAAPLHAFVRDADDLLRSPDLVRVRTIRNNSPETRFVLD